MSNELIVGILVVSVIIVKFILPSLLCKFRGHKLKEDGAGVLWKKCSCCNKTFVLHMASGKYIE